MEITLTVTVRESSDRRKSPVHELTHTFGSSAPPAWNSGSIAAEMLRAGVDAYEQRILIQSMPLEAATHVPRRHRKGMPVPTLPLQEEFDLDRAIKQDDAREEQS
jgi:hypothetical protein